MGIPGILKEVGRGERIALSKLAVEHLERTRRPLRIAIDAAIWNFQNQAGQGGRNPELRTLFYRLLKLLALPIHPVFVYDGKNKPLTKRGKTVSAYGTCIPNEMSKKLVQLFRYPHHTAPGEAEAECAFLQKHGIVDAVMSQDVDAIMFGSEMTLRNWTKEATRGNKTATHVDVLRAGEVKDASGLTPEGLILVAMLSGGDYDADGVAGFGVTLACEVAKAGFGEELLELVAKDDLLGLREWRDRLQVELETNESGYFKVKRKTLRVPTDFPDRTILGYYTNPAVSPMSELPLLQKKWEDVWDQDIDLAALRQYVADRFDWLYDTGAKKLTRCLAPSLLAHRLLCGLEDKAITSMDQITERRSHFINDGMPELRVKVTPGEIVGIDMSTEEKNPGWAAADEGIIDDEEAPVDIEASADVDEGSAPPTASQKARKSPPWDPTIAEKMWIPETILQLGVPALVEAWQQKQRDILADPVKFATRKAKPKAQTKFKDSAMKAGALDGFFAASKPGSGQSREASTKAAVRAPLQTADNLLVKQVQTTPTKRPRSKEQNATGARLPSPAPSPQRNRVISNFLRELESVGSEPQEVIFFDVSPTRASVTAPESTQETVLISEDEHDSKAAPRPAPATAIPKKRGLRRVKSPTTLPGRKAVPKSPAKVTVPIESFFGVSKYRTATASKNAPKPIKAAATRPVLPPDISLGLKVDLLATKKVAVPRDSLPGTWRETDPALIDESSSPRTRGRPRVSYVDLSGDCG
jgi:Holliday junction resolvase YEN1